MKFAWRYGWRTFGWRWALAELMEMARLHRVEGWLYRVEIDGLTGVHMARYTGGRYQVLGVIPGERLYCEYHPEIVRVHAVIGRTLRVPQR